MLLYIIGILMVVVIVLSAIIYHKDKLAWNNGRCPKCGSRWRFKGSHLGETRVYKCTHCGNEIFVSYRVDSDYYKKLEDYEVQ